MTTKKLAEEITLEELLSKKFGQDQVVVKKWTWTEEQLKELKEEENGK